MTVGELIRQLQGFKSEYEVIQDRYEGGTDPISKVDLVWVDKAAGQDWCGDYGDAEDSNTDMTKPELVVYIH